ncbi:ABC transporter permease [Oceanobacillus sp. FSL H7-0719]|uniref:ABC transporter permease n=1 Tax=Oceanobacillus sp. FSL H7-0719 TaxID=2954507 RepID=UPI00324CFAFB
MVHILKREFIDSFKSVRAILMILFITFISYQAASAIKDYPGLVDELISEGNTSVYIASLAMIVLVLGFLFVFATSHDVINKEIELRTMRLLVTKQSRLEIILGKFLGTYLFWIFTLSISFIIISVIAGDFFAGDYFRVISFMFYIVSFVLLLSTIIPRAKVTMFVGILLGIFLPIIGMTSIFSEKSYLIILKYLLPFYYMDGSYLLAFVPIGIGVIYLVIALGILQRKDL